MILPSTKDEIKIQVIERSEKAKSGEALSPSDYSKEEGLSFLPLLVSPSFPSSFTSSFA